MGPMETRRAAARVTWSQVAAFRLSRHHLSERAPTSALLSVVRDMAGAQAQVLLAAQISLWARVRDLQVKDVEGAVRERELVKAWCMRHTLHLLPSEDLVIFVRGSAGRAEREIRWARGKGVSDRVLENLIDSTLSVMDQPLTRQEIAERVSQLLRVRVRTFRGGGWGNRAKIPAVAAGGLTFPVVYLLTLVGARGVICSGPNRNNEPTFVRADAWIRKWRDISREQAEEELLCKYLRTFGPATPLDFAHWVGMRLADAREIWAREEAHIVPVNVDGWEAAALRDDIPQLERAEFERPPVRLLPYFDVFLLGHKERGHLVPAARNRKRVYRTQGWIAPVVLVDGRVAGMWAHAREGDRLRIRVTKFDPISRRIAAGIRAEARGLARFLGCADVDVEI